MKQAQKILLIVLLAGIALRFLYLSTSVSHIHASGDESIFALQSIGITQASDSIEFQAKNNPRGAFNRFPLLFLQQPYLFPLESYVWSPIIRFLPRTALGMRIPVFLAGLAALLLSILILRRMGPPDKIWPAWLLVLLPSPYLLIFMAAYSPPSYPAFITFSLIGVWLAIRSEENRSWIACALCGLLMGLVCSTSLLAAPLVVSLFLFFSLNGKPKTFLINGPVFGASLWVGLLPIWIAKDLYPGAYNTVTGTADWGTALSRLWNPITTFSIPSTLGYITTIIPDAAEIVHPLGLKYAPIFGVLYILFMLAMVLICAVRFVQRTLKDRWPSICLMDVWTATSIVAIVLFSKSTRFAAGECRYLLYLPMFLPFLLAQSLLLCPDRKTIRRSLFAACIFMAGLNTVTALMLVRYWQTEDHGGLFNDSRPAIAYMKEQGITHCYASYFDAYTINYLSGEEILCSQPYNERFYGWPLPYKRQVDVATNVAYALGPSHRFKSEDFARDLENRKIRHTITKVGKFDIYYNFENDFYLPGEKRIPKEQLTITSYPDGQEQPILHDGLNDSRWISSGPQSKDLAISISLPQPTRVSRIHLYYNLYRQPLAESTRIIVGEEGTENFTEVTASTEIDGIELVNGHPVYNNEFQSIPFDPTYTDKITLRLEHINPDHPWVIGEIVVFHLPDGADLE